MRTIAIAGLVALTACSDGGPSAPIQDANIGGTWHYFAGGLTSSEGVTCFADLTMSLTQTTASFHGTYIGELTCVAGGESESLPVQGQVANGSVDGNSIAFNIDSSDFHNTGSVSGGSMGGNATLRLQVTLTGPWSASRL